MKIIKLTQGQETKIDDCDFDRFAHLKWMAVKSPCTGGFYAGRSQWIPDLGRCTHVSLHRAILGKSADGLVVDHINHDTLDNRRKNLRACTKSQNSMNRRGPASNGSSGIRGVTWNKRRSKWIAKIKSCGKHLSVGQFDSKNDAALAYRAANKKYFGEFGGEV